MTWLWLSLAAALRSSRPTIWRTRTANGCGTGWRASARWATTSAATPTTAALVRSALRLLWPRRRRPPPLFCTSLGGPAVPAPRTASVPGLVFDAWVVVGQVVNAQDPPSLFRPPWHEQHGDIVEIEPDTGVVRMLANYEPLGPGPGTWTMTVVVETLQCKRPLAIGYVSVAQRNCLCHAAAQGA